MKPLSKKLLDQTLKRNFTQLENDAFENVMSHDATLKEFNYDTTTLIICKQITFGEHKGEIWKITVYIDKRIVNQKTKMPLRTIDVEPLQNTSNSQKSYQYNLADNSVYYMIKRNDAKGLVAVTDKSEVNKISLLCQLLNKGDMLDTVDYLEPQKPKRHLKLIHFIKIPQVRA